MCVWDTLTKKKSLIFVSFNRMKHPFILPTHTWREVERERVMIVLFTGYRLLVFWLSNFFFEGLFFHLCVSWIQRKNPTLEGKKERKKKFFSYQCMSVIIIFFSLILFLIDQLSFESIRKKNLDFYFGHGVDDKNLMILAI